MDVRLRNGLRRGELARRTGVHPETVRYFEKAGILSEPPRSAGGHRVYDEADVRRLRFVRRARSLGFSPDEVRTMLALGGPESAPCAEIRAIATRHLGTVRAKLADLTRLEEILTETIGECTGTSATDCAVIGLIDSGGADYP